MEPSLTLNTEMTIDTGENLPISSPPYSIPHARIQMAKDEVRDMLMAGIIVRSKSPWAAPLLLVHKKDGKMRPVIDFRRLNRLTVPDPYPMPRSEELIEELARARYITTLDLAKGYWQVPVAEASQEKTAFVTSFGKYQFRRMPFGLTGAPATFQRMMDTLLEDLPQTVVYIDDVAVHSVEWEDHLKQVDATLDRIEKAGLTLKPTKCHMGFFDCEYLGHKVGGGLIRPGAAKIQAIRDFVVPKRKKDVRSFLGLASYYRRYVPGFATIAAPLSDLTRTSEPDKTQWTSQTQEAFQKLKDALTSAPVLRGVDFSKEFTLQTDASNVGIGAVLSQQWESGDQPVAFFSRKLIPRERNWAAMDKECLAIVEGIRHFAFYLTGVPFTVVTDLQFLDSVRDNGGKRTRWTLLLQEFNFKVLHRAGEANGNAD